MDRSYASQLQDFFKATLLGFVLFSMVTLVPHVCSCLRTFLFVSIPSTASAIATPKCLFLFSNIIVIFLARESRLSQGSANHQLPVPVTKERDANHAAEDIVKEEQQDSMVDVAHESLQQLDDQSEQEDAPSTTFGVQALHMEEEEELGRVEPREEVIVQEECEELPTDELNRRVEDFIARFNMERQLEARTLVCCF